MKHLYIIGNGFDIHHRIPSRYQDFKKWLLENDEDTHNSIVEIFGADEPTWWKEFESRLGEPFPIQQYAENISFENQPDYGSDDYRDRDLYAAEYEVERKLGGLIDSLKSDFQQWASELPLGNGDLSIKMETNDAFFLTFNYSLTLERLYRIPQNRILHIHGDALNKETIVVGHGCDYSAFRDNLNNDIPEPPDDLQSAEYSRWLDEIVPFYSDDYPTSQAKDAAAYAMMAMWKNVHGIIEKNKAFFHSLSGVEFIHVYGFSFADVDIPYLLEVIKNVDLPNVEMEISYYSDDDKKRIQHFLDGIPTLKSYRLVNLMDLLRIKQQSLFN